MTISRYPDTIPYLTTDQMIEVDRAMMEDYKIELIQMMENAGRNLASLARERFFGGNPVGHHVVVLAGSGGNGGRRPRRVATTSQLGRPCSGFYRRGEKGFYSCSCPSTRYFGKDEGFRLSGRGDTRRDGS